MEKKKSIGAFWLKESKSGQKFMTGKVDFNGSTLELVVFKNNYKKEEKHPDYVIYKSEKREQPNNYSQPDTSEIRPEEIPF